MRTREGAEGMGDGGRGMIPTVGLALAQSACMFCLDQASAYMQDIAVEAEDAEHYLDETYEDAQVSSSSALRVSLRYWTDRQNFQNVTLLPATQRQVPCSSILTHYPPKGNKIFFRGQFIGSFRSFDNARKPIEARQCPRTRRNLACVSRFIAKQAE